MSETLKERFNQAFQRAKNWEEAHVDPSWGTWSQRVFESTDNNGESVKLAVVLEAGGLLNKAQQIRNLRGGILFVSLPQLDGRTPGGASGFNCLDLNDGYRGPLIKLNDRAGINTVMFGFKDSDDNQQNQETMDKIEAALDMLDRAQPL